MAAKVLSVRTVPPKRPRATSGMLRVVAAVILVSMLLILTLFMTADSSDVTQLLTLPGLLAHVTGSNHTTPNSTKTKGVTIPPPKIARCDPKTRLRNVADICRRQNWTDNIDLRRSESYRRILVDASRGIMYCDVPGIGNSFKYLLALTTGKVKPNETESLQTRLDDEEYLSSIGLDYLDVYALQDIQFKILRYYKIMVVGHPLNRLANVFLKNETEVNELLAPSIDTTRQINETETEFNGTLMTNNSTNPTTPIPMPLSQANQFEIFLNAIEQSNIENKHWQSYFDICHPCDIFYDQILKLETLKEDIDPIYDVLSFMQNSSVPTSFATTYNKLNEAVQNLKAGELFQEIGEDIIKKLLKSYNKDFELYGYKWNNSTGINCVNASCC